MLASFGRGFYILDDYSPLRHVDQEMSKTNQVFPIQTAKIFEVSEPLAVGTRGFQGANFYTAPNPAYGATITYHLKDSLKTQKSERKAQDRKAAAAGKDTSYPSWEEFKAEDREVAPSVYLNIRDQDGELVSRINGSTSRGMHRTSWNLRHDGYGRFSPIAVPGTYTVDVTQVVDGETTELVTPVEFKIEPLMADTMDESTQASTLEFLEQANGLWQSVNGATSVADQAEEQLAAIERVVDRSVKLDQELANEVRQLQLKLMDIQEAFNGDPTKPRRNEPELPGITSRVRNMMFGALGSLEGPTGTHRRQYEIARQQFEETVGELNALVEDDLPALNKKLDEAGAPWTPGRDVPKLK